MRVKRCDCCGKDIEPCMGKLFTMKKYYVKASFEDVPGKYLQYDLCDRCAKFIDDTIKVGVKPEWLGIEPKEGA